MTGSDRDPVGRGVAWVYEGTWAVVARLFKVPRQGPTLPASPGEAYEQFHPAPGYLSYLRLWFWLGLVVFDGLILGGWLAIFLANPGIGSLLALPAVVVAVAPDIIAYVAIHLRYDNMWYVLSERSMRLRRGIWIIAEVTITFENVQNVKVRSGPVQRFFGIADVLVETAGAGAGRGEAPPSVANQALFEGVADAARISDLVLARVRRSLSTGSGDEATMVAGSTDVGRTRWSRSHLALLEEIRNALRPGGQARAEGTPLGMRAKNFGSRR